MFKKIITFVVVGFVAVAQAESSLFSMFKQQAAAAAPQEAVPTTTDESSPQFLQNLMEMGIENLSSTNWVQDTNDIFTLCDTNKSGWITQAEALKCGNQELWNLVKPFDANRNQLLTWMEVYNAVKYYHTNQLVSLASGAEETAQEPLELADVSPDAMKSFFDVSLLGQSLLSQKTRYQVDQMYLQADTNRDGKLSRQEIITASQKSGQAITNAQLAPIFEILDTNNDGTISKQELLNFLQSPSQWTNLVFRFLDYNRDGYINFAEFKRFIQENKPYNQAMPSDSEIKKSIASIDFNKDGRVSWSEVYSIMQQLQQLENNQ